MSEAGKVLYPGAKKVKQVVTEAIVGVYGYGASVTGYIRMSVLTISDDLLLANSIADFCNKHPDLAVDISLENTFVDLIQGGYDLVIRTARLDDSYLIARHLIDSQWVVCAIPSYQSSAGKSLAPQNLVRYNGLQYENQVTKACEWEFKGDPDNYIIKVSGNFSTNYLGA